MLDLAARSKSNSLLSVSSVSSLDSSLDRSSSMMRGAAVTTTLGPPALMLPSGTSGLRVSLGPPVAVPAGIRATLGDVPNDDLKISTVIGVGLAMSKKLDDPSVAKVKVEYEKLKVLIHTKLNLPISTHPLKGRSVEDLKVQINTFSREAYVWVNDGRPSPQVHTIPLGNDANYVAGMNAMQRAAKSDASSIVIAQAGISGHMKNPTALRCHHLGSKDHRTQTLKRYASSFLPEILKTSSDPINASKTVMKKLSAATTYKEYLDEFLSTKINECERKIAFKKSSGSPSNQIALEENLLEKLQGKLKMVNQVDLLAVFFRLSQRDSVNATKFATNYRKFLDEVIKVKDPKGMNEYTHAAAGLVISQDDYTKHCVDHGLDITRSMPVEQWLCNNVLGRDPVGLLGDIQNVTGENFNSDLEKMISKAKAHVESRNQAIDTKECLEVKSLIDGCLSAHDAALLKSPSDVVPPSPPVLRSELYVRKDPPGAPARATLSS